MQFLTKYIANRYKEYKIKICMSQAYTKFCDCPFTSTINMSHLVNMIICNKNYFHVLMSISGIFKCVTLARHKLSYADKFNMKDEPFLVIKNYAYYFIFWVNFCVLVWDTCGDKIINRHH